MSIYIGCGTEKGDVFSIIYNCSSSQFVDLFIDKQTRLGAVTSVLADENQLLAAGRIGALQSYCFNSGTKLYTFDNSHESSITSLSLSNDKKYLFTSDDKGLIVIWKRSGSSWVNIQNIDKHTKSAMLSLHPSDKFAMSISKDNTLRVWNLYNGLQSHKMPFRKPYISITISPNGKYYLLRTFNLIHIYDFEEASLKYTLKTAGNIKDLVFLNDSMLCVGELKKISFYKLSESVENINSIDLGLCQLKNLSYTESPEIKYLICSVSSNSEMSIQIYDVSLIEDANKTPALLNTYEVHNLRITAMSSVFK